MGSSIVVLRRQGGKLQRLYYGSFNAYPLLVHVLLCHCIQTYFLFPSHKGPKTGFLLSSINTISLAWMSCPSVVRLVQ